MDTRAIHLTISDLTGTTTVTAIAGVDAEELGADLRALDFVATPAGITLDAPAEATAAAIELLRTWGYEVTVLGGA